MSRKFKLNQCVALIHDLPEHGLKGGTVGTVIEEFSNPHEAYEIEFIGKDGRPIAQVALTPEKLTEANFG